MYNFSQLFELFTFDGYFFENKSLNLQSDIIFKKKEIYNMKKFTIFFTLLVAMTTTAIADNIQVSTSTSNPEHRYTMKNGNNLFANSNTAPTQTEANYGHFAFYAVEGVTDAYYIYSVNANKYISYTKASSYSSGPNKVTLVDNRENYFKITKCTTNNTYYELHPYKSDNTAANLYINWHGGIDSNPLDGNSKLGLYTHNGDQDGGSRYLFTEIEVDIYQPYATGERTGDKNWRKISKITLNNNDLEISEDEQTQYYVNKTDYRFTVRVEEDINISVTINTSNPWMHSYVYIDKDNNGFTATLDSNGYTPIGDLVSYSAYTTGSQYKNSVGTIVLDNPTLNGIPQFKAPTTPGTYRMRYKMDWNDINPNGDESFVSNCGFIVDFMLEVQPAVSSRTITVSTESTDCVVKANDTVGGVTADGEIVLTAEPAFGYNFVEWRLGDEVVSTDTIYTDKTDGDKIYVAVFERMTDEELYASIAKPTFSTAGGTTYVNSIIFNNSELTINNIGEAQRGKTNLVTEIPEVEAGKTYQLNIKYKLDWGDLAIFQIDKNGINKKYGYYTCVWVAEGNPLTILKERNANLMCDELELNSIDDLDYRDNLLNIPYNITIGNNLIPGDVVVIRAMIAKDGDAYNKQGITEGSCLDIILKVTETDYRQQLEDVFTVLANYQNNNMIGTKFGQYSTTHDHIALLNEVGLLLYATANPDVNEYKTKIIEVQNVINSLTLNLPTANNYFTVAYDYGENVGVLYMQGIPTEQEKNGQNSYAAKFSNETNAASIWLYYDGALYSYTAGCCIKELGNDRGLQAVGVKQTATFSISTRDKNKYNINCGAYIHANMTGSNYYSDHCGENSCIQHDLILEEVTTLPVTIGDALYATFYAPVAVGVPEGVNAYYLAADGIKNNIAKLTDIGDIIPANTGVILEATQAGIYNFNITETDLTVTNLLKGTVAAKYIEEESYVLSKPNDKELGLYKAQMKDVGTATTSGKGFKNNSHKVYLPENELSSVAQGSNGFRIVFGGTTAIEEIEASVKDENKNEIYDLTGRKLEGFNGTGVYIVNGKKVVR